MCVHQIYGVFGDGKPMDQVFKASQQAWKTCAARMGAQYHLWNSDEVETLMRTRYPQFWELYTRVRYPIMRVDIGRIAILHAYGGMYADLDTLPNRQWYSQAQLAVACVSAPTAGWKYSEKDCDKPSEDKLEMEVIVGAYGEPFFLRWLRRMAEEIDDKPYRGPNTFLVDCQDAVRVPHDRAGGNEAVLGQAGECTSQKPLAAPQDELVQGHDAPSLPAAPSFRHNRNRVEQLLHERT